MNPQTAIKVESAAVFSALAATIIGTISPLQRLVEWGYKASKIIESNISIKIALFIITLRLIAILSTTIIWFHKQQGNYDFERDRLIQTMLAIHVVLSGCQLGLMSLLSNNSTYHEFALINNTDLLLSTLQILLLWINSISTKKPSVTSTSLEETKAPQLIQHTVKHRKTSPTQAKKWKTFWQNFLTDNNEYLSGWQWLLRNFTIYCIAFTISLIAENGASKDSIIWAPIIIFVLVFATFIMSLNTYKRLKTIGYGKSAIWHVIILILTSYFVSDLLAEDFIDRAQGYSALRKFIVGISPIYNLVQFFNLLFSSNTCYLSVSAPQSFRHLKLRDDNDKAEVATLLEKAIEIASSKGEFKDVILYIDRKKSKTSESNDYESKNFELKFRKLSKKGRPETSLTQYTGSIANDVTPIKSENAVAVLSSQLHWVRESIEDEVINEEAPEKNHSTVSIHFKEPDRVLNYEDLGFALYRPNFSGPYGLEKLNPICVGNSLIKDYLLTLEWKGIRVNPDWIEAESTHDPNGTHVIKLTPLPGSPISQMNPIFVTREFYSKSYFRYSPDSSFFKKTE